MRATIRILAVTIILGAGSLLAAVHFAPADRAQPLVAASAGQQPAGTALPLTLGDHCSIRRSWNGPPFKGVPFVRRAGGARQAHVIWPTRGDRVLFVANQNGKKLERIFTNYSCEIFTQQPEATLDLANCTTPNGHPSCLHEHSASSGASSRPAAPLRVSIANQYAMRARLPVVRHGQVAPDLAHERLIWVWCRPEPCSRVATPRSITNTV